MNCKELVYLLGEYLEGTMDANLRRELDVHISMCESCLNFLNTYDRTRALCRQIRPEEIPEEFKARLKSFVMQKAEEHHRDVERYIRMAEEERRREVAALVAAIRERKLSPTMEVLVDAHRDRCPRCGAFLRSINGDESSADLSPELVRHLGEIVDALPPGEEPFLA